MKTFKEMEDAFYKEVRRELLSGLLLHCTINQQDMFKKMYAGKNQNWTIKSVVNKMSRKHLSWAMQQTENTRKSNLIT